jgi:hypothetical protein
LEFTMLETSDQSSFQFPRGGWMTEILSWLFGA